MGCLEDHKVLRLLLAKRNIFIVLLLPILLLPLPIAVPTPAGKCGYVALLMVVFLLTEPIPLPITCLLPAILFPVLSIQSAKTVAASYANDVLIFVIAIMIIATAIEGTNLHRRIVLRCLIVIGTKPYRILIGLMSSAFLLSMLVPNLAVVPMMMPIALGITKELDKEERMKREKNSASGRKVSNVEIEMDSKDDNGKLTQQDEDQRQEIDCYYRGGKYMLLGILYGLNLGGSATLIGTTQPPIANGYMVGRYGPGSVISYGKWIAFALPLELVSSFFVYLWVIFLMWKVTRKTKNKNVYVSESEEDNIGNDDMQPKDGDKELDGGVKAYIKQESLKLGGLTWAEGCTIALITSLTALLCLTDMDDVDGWFALFPDGYTSNTCATCLIALLFFVLPRDLKQFNLIDNPTKYTSILEWTYVVARVPWGVIITLGGYFALGSALQATGALAGFEDFLSENLVKVDSWIIVLAITIFVSLFTEVVGNMAVLLVFLPIVTSLAEATNNHPHLFVIPLILADQMSLMLPIATVPNLVFVTYANTSTIDMIKCGWMVNIICLFFVNLFINTYGYVIFDFDTLPDWASLATTTMSTVTNATTV